MHPSTPGGNSRVASSKRAGRLTHRTFFDHRDSTNKFPFSRVNVIATKIARASGQGSLPVLHRPRCRLHQQQCKDRCRPSSRSSPISIKRALKQRDKPRKWLGLSLMTLPAAICETEKRSVIERPDAEGMRLTRECCTQTPASTEDDGDRVRIVLHGCRHRGRLTVCSHRLVVQLPLLYASCVPVKRGAGSAPEFPQIIEWLSPRLTMASRETRRPLARPWMRRDARPGLSRPER